MRELLFRAWHKKLKVMTEEWGFEDRVWDGDLFETHEIVSKGVDKLIDEDATLWYLDEMIIMLYIGLKDKNNKKVFEGDIVRDTNGSNFEVMWEKDLICGQGGMTASGFTFNDYPKDMEIVGNIYEDKRLLKKVINRR